MGAATNIAGLDRLITALQTTSDPATLAEVAALVGTNTEGESIDPMAALEKLYRMRDIAVKHLARSSRTVIATHEAP